MYNTIENVSFKNISATPANFILRGGNYGITAHAGTWGTATLQRLSPDGSTFVTVLAALSADGYSNLNLPNGTYQLLLSGITGIYIDIVSVVTTL